MDLLTANPVYKPFRYPWAYEAWLQQQRIHWLPEEVPLADDVKDWQKNLTAAERNLLTQIFRFFTQADVEVNNCYMKQYSQVFKPTEVLMMMSAFSNTETIHIAAYSHLLDTIGMPEIEYTAFLKYKEMKDKYDYMQGFNVDSKADIEAYGIEAFNARCRESVQRYVGAFEDLTERIGFWIDTDDAYRTMDAEYVDSLWWALKELWDRDLIFEDFRVAPYCGRCGTALSDAEVAQGYESVREPLPAPTFAETAG